MKPLTIGESPTPATGQPITCACTETVLVCRCPELAETSQEVRQALEEIDVDVEIHPVDPFAETREQDRHVLQVLRPTCRDLALSETRLLLILQIADGQQQCVLFRNR